MKYVAVCALLAILSSSFFFSLNQPVRAADWMYRLQDRSVRDGASAAAHWGPDPTKYSTWTTHTNRLIPVYTFGTLGAGEGVDLESYVGERSLYRSEERLRRLYQRPADDILSASAVYMDQTNVFDLQLAALDAGKKHIFLVVFDGLDWETTRAASLWNLQRVAYEEGRGTGLHFQDYSAGGTSQFGWMVTSPCRDGIQVDVDEQRVKNPGGGLAGGYCPKLGGATPWSRPTDAEYLVAGPKDGTVRHAYADSASSATSMTSGIKTFNAAINVSSTGQLAATIAHLAQIKGYRVGVVTSVPISHATPAAAYAHNVSRNDYQDLTRDLLGLPSISHPERPLPGLDVVIGAGHGVELLEDKHQGENFVEGNVYLTQHDLEQIDAERGGPYVTSLRTVGVDGGEQLQADALRAAQEKKRLLGYYGLGDGGQNKPGHLPFASADGDYQPAPGIDGDPIQYQAEDLTENPTLAEMTTAALTVVAADGRPFWLMVEAGDVDWANHENNLDASIGAVNSGDAAVRVITDWVEAHSNWDESVMILTGDHGHYLVIDCPERLFRGGSSADADAAD